MPFYQAASKIKKLGVLVARTEKLRKYSLSVAVSDKI
jgi:hypothetical protein